MEDDLNIFLNERRPQFFQMKEDLNFVCNNGSTNYMKFVGQPNILENGRKLCLYQQCTEYYMTFRVGVRVNVQL